MRGRGVLAVLAVLLVLLLGTAQASAAGLQCDLPLLLEKSAPAELMQAMPEGMQTYVCARTILSQVEYAFHVYRPKPDVDGVSRGAAQMDVFSLGSRPTLLHHLDLEDFSPSPQSPPDVVLVYLRPSRNVGPMLVFSQSPRDLMAVIFPQGFYERPRYQQWRSPESTTRSCNYEIGPVDTSGYRTLRVTCSEGGGKPQTFIRRWLGDRFEMGN